MKKGHRLGYKVVEFTGGGLSSACSRSAVDYKIGEVVCPHKGEGPLSVFKNRISAEMFVRSYKYHALSLYRCVYKPSKRKTVWYQPLRIYGNEPPVIRTSSKHFPRGTILADCVTLLEKVEVA